VLDFHRQPSLGGLRTFDDFERWLDLNVRYLRKIGYTKGGRPQRFEFKREAPGT